MGFFKCNRLSRTGEGQLHFARFRLLIVLIVLHTMVASAIKTELYYFLIIDPYQHEDYGFSYPVTYQFHLPEANHEVVVFKKYRHHDSWEPLVTHTSDDFFNGVEASRLDGPKKMIYVSAAFGDDSDTLFLKFSDPSGSSIRAIYQGISKYYDNRRAAVTSTADDWAVWFDEKFQRTCRIFRDHKLWVSPAIITNGCDSATWVHIQDQIDSGYVDVVSHSRTHPYIPYADINSEVTGSKWDLIQNLQLPDASRKGSHEYVYVWVAPYGSYDGAIDAYVSWNQYLVTRLYHTGSFQYPEWDPHTKKYHTTGVSREMGPLWAGTTDISDLNAAFDQAYNVGGVYHVMCHPNVIEWDQEYPWLHLDYINEHKDVWYVGMGHLFVYHYLKEFADSFITFYSSEESIQWDLPIKIYPNPFKYETRIRYTLQDNVFVRLGIYDSMGRLIRLMVSEEQHEGPHEVILDADDLIPGLYIYKLEAGNRVKTGRMIRVN